MAWNRLGLAWLDVASAWDFNFVTKNSFCVCTCFFFSLSCSFSTLVRYTGDVREHARTSVFAWEAADRGQEVHPVADPSQAEMLRKKFDDKKTTLKEVRGKKKQE